MRVIFMGTPDFAVPSLAALLKNKLSVLAVVTQPDRRAGRGKKMRPSPVKAYAQKMGLPVYQPEKVGDPAFVQTLKGLQPDVIAVAAFGQILPNAILKLPRYGCINVHASLLPAYRGAAPIHRVVMGGEPVTGVTIMQMDQGLDTGDMILKESIVIGPDDTTGLIHDKLAVLGGHLLVQALQLLKAGQANFTPQPHQAASYAARLTKQDEIINWRQTAQSIKNQIRGLNPWPGARTTVDGKILKIWRADVINDVAAADLKQARPGQVLKIADDNGVILVQTGQGVLAVLELQLQGKNSLDCAAFLCGNDMISPGVILGAS